MAKEPRYFYFTFGTDPAFPFKENEYIVALASCSLEAELAFKQNHPNRPGSDCYNYSFMYTQEEFDTFRDKYYPNALPSEILQCDPALLTQEEAKAIEEYAALEAAAEESLEGPEP